MAQNRHKVEQIRQLSEDLILRRASVMDTEKLAEFNSRVHSDAGWDEPFKPVGEWTRDLMTKDHPTFKPEYFTVVENLRTGEIVSSLNLIPQTWTYAGIPIQVGRPELVGTHPDFRNQGLVRAQFEEIHRWGTERGDLMQAITGIPYYYRLFGYEMAINLDGGRTGYTVHVPELKEGQSEPFNIRPAKQADLKFIKETYEYGARRSLISCQRDMDMWQYELSGHSENSINGRALQIIERTEDKEPVGFLAHPRMMWGQSIVATHYELKAGFSWLEVTQSVIRYLYKTGKEYEKTGEETCQAFTFALGVEHPVFEAAQDRLPRKYDAYAYYVRVPDLPRFLRRIKPALENRLASSIAVGHTGELKISFYRHGLKFVFESGKIIEILPWDPAPHSHSGDANFPGLTFLQLLFGYRSLEELIHAYPDVTHPRDTARVLINTLFPKQASHVWPIN